METSFPLGTKMMDLTTALAFVGDVSLDSETREAFDDVVDRIHEGKPYLLALRLALRRVR
jgi:hypothetical protein